MPITDGRLIISDIKHLFKLNMALKFTPRVISIPICLLASDTGPKSPEVRLIGEFVDEVIGVMNLATTRTVDGETVYIYVKNIEDRSLPTDYLDSFKKGNMHWFPHLLGYSQKPGDKDKQEKGPIVQLLFEPFDEPLYEILLRKIDSQASFEESFIYQIINGSLQVR